MLLASAASLFYSSIPEPWQQSLLLLRTTELDSFHGYTRLSDLSVSLQHTLQSLHRMRGDDHPPPTRTIPKPLVKTSKIANVPMSPTPDTVAAFTNTTGTLVFLAIATGFVWSWLTRRKVARRKCPWSPQSSNTNVNVELANVASSEGDRKPYWELILGRTIDVMLSEGLDDSESAQINVGEYRTSRFETPVVDWIAIDSSTWSSSARSSMVKATPLWTAAHFFVESMAHIIANAPMDPTVGSSIVTRYHAHKEGSRVLTEAEHIALLEFFIDEHPGVLAAGAALSYSLCDKQPARNKFWPPRVGQGTRLLLPSTVQGEIGFERHGLLPFRNAMNHIAAKLGRLSGELDVAKNAWALGTIPARMEDGCIQIDPLLAPEQETDELERTWRGYWLHRTGDDYTALRPKIETVLPEDDDEDDDENDHDELERTWRGYWLHRTVDDYTALCAKIETLLPEGDDQDDDQDDHDEADDEASMTAEEEKPRKKHRRKRGLPKWKQALRLTLSTDAIAAIEYLDGEEGGMEGQENAPPCPSCSDAEPVTSESARLGSGDGGCDAAAAAACAGPGGGGGSGSSSGRPMRTGVGMEGASRVFCQAMMIIQGQAPERRGG